MLRTESFPSRVLSPFREESGDEELSVLPRHTKVVVKGNNRTKSVLVGLQGVVKKAVGLGGWHWLVLKNGVEVKLQRNALSVLEPPNGNEEDGDYDLDDSSSASETVEKDHHHFSASLHLGKISKPRARYRKPWSPFVSTKAINRACYQEVHSKSHAAPSSINLANLGIGSLWRYCQSYHLEHTSSNPSKDQLLSAVHQHFSSQRLDEVQVIVEFIQAAKKLRSVGTK